MKEQLLVETYIARRLWDFLSELNNNNDPDHYFLKEVPVAPASVYEKVSSAPDILKHVVAASYYQELAALIDCSYMSHPFRNLLYCLAM